MSFFILKGVIILNNIGYIIKEQRIKNNISLDKLSKISNISVSTLYNIENDKLKKVNSVFIYRLCKILNIDYDYLTRIRWEIHPIFLNERKKYIAGKSNI